MAYPFPVACCPPDLDPDVAAFRPAELAQCGPERRDPFLCFRISIAIRDQHRDLSQSIGPLCLGGERRGEETAYHGSEERSPIHEVPSVRVSVSACSSQNGMSISRYIVIAVVRCSCASCRLPVRRWSLPRPRWQWAASGRNPISEA